MRPIAQPRVKQPRAGVSSGCGRYSRVFSGNVRFWHKSGRRNFTVSCLLLTHFGHRRDPPPGAKALMGLARTRRRNANKVDPGIGRTRLGQRIFQRVFLIGTRFAPIMASGFSAAQTGRTHARTQLVLQLRQRVLAKAPSTHDPKLTCWVH